jgi:hypothetical protein
MWGSTTPFISRSKHMEQQVQRLPYQSKYKTRSEICGVRRLPSYLALNFKFTWNSRFDNSHISLNIKFTLKYVGFDDSLRISL